MKRLFASVIVLFIMCFVTACGADVDLLLENGQSEDGTVISSGGEDDDGGNAATGIEDGSGEADSADAASDGSDDGSAEDEEGNGLICAYICGAVKTPGVYEVESGSRVFALVELAGGMTEDADCDAVNLAREVSDGEMVYIPTEEETASGEVVPESAGTASTQSASTSGGTAASSKININTATAEELTALSGIGDAKAAAIVAYRDEHGSFSSTEDIMNVSGIGQSTYDKIKDDITV